MLLCGNSRAGWPSAATMMLAGRLYKMLLLQLLLLPFAQGLTRAIWVSQPDLARVSMPASQHRLAAPPAMGLFDGLFGESDAQREAKDRAFEAQQEILARRRNPGKNTKYLQDIEERRRRESANFRQGIAWQQDTTKDPLFEFKRRQAANKVKPLGYEDVPKGGIQLPMPSFGVGGEFGVGGKYDYGERFDLRLPYVDQGWVEEPSDTEQVPFWENLLSGGRLQREATQRAQKEAKKKKGQK